MKNPPAPPKFNVAEISIHRHTDPMGNELPKPVKRIIAQYFFPPVGKIRVNNAACIEVLAADGQMFALHAVGSWDTVQMGYVDPKALAEATKAAEAQQAAQKAAQTAMPSNVAPFPTPIP